MNTPSNWWLITLTVCGAAVASPQVVTLYPVNRNGQFGYADTTGHIVIPPQFEQARAFSEGLAPIRSGGNWGYVNLHGEIAIRPRFADALPLSEGLAAVKVGPSYGYIDAAGILRLTPRYERAGTFHGGRAAVRFNGQWTYIRTNGTELDRPPEGYRATQDFSDGLAAVKVGDLWGFVDTAGSSVLAPRWSWVGAFGDGLAPVRIGAPNHATTGFISRTGAVVITPRFWWAGPFSGGVAPVQFDERLWGYIDKTGRRVVPPTFASAGSFSGARAIVLDLFGRSWYIRRDGVKAFPESDVITAGALGADTLLDLELQSKPTGADVYLVPLERWEADSVSLKNRQRLTDFLVPQGPTNRKTRVYQQVYWAFSWLGRLHDRKRIDVVPTQINSIFFNLADTP